MLVDGDRLVVADEQDVQAVTDLNRAEYATYRRGTDRWGEWGDLVARIPLVVWDDLVRRRIAYDDKALLKWLDDPDNAAFRRRPGRLSR